MLVVIIVVIVAVKEMAVKAPQKKDIGIGTIPQNRRAQGDEKTHHYDKNRRCSFPEHYTASNSTPPKCQLDGILPKKPVLA